MKQAKPGATLNIFNFGRSAKPEPAETEPETPVKSTKPRPKKIAQAPRGVPTISNWNQNRDGSIAGNVFGSTSFDAGESVTTSAITSDAIGGTVVETESGSRYYLEDDDSAQSRIQEAKEEAALAKEQEADEKRAAAEDRRIEAEEKRAAEAEAREFAAEEKRAQAEEKKREAEERKAAVAEAKELAAEEKKAAAEAKRIEAEEKRASQSTVKQAEQSVSRAKPGQTIKLFNFGQSAAPVSSAPKKLANAPRGVPVISNWKQDRDGGIGGNVFGSPSFDEGEFVSTSPITSDAVGGTVVTTVSRSK